MAKIKIQPVWPWAKMDPNFENNKLIFLDTENGNLELYQYRKPSAQKNFLN